MTVLHTKSVRDNTGLRKSDTFVKVAGVNIALNHGVELKNAKPERFCRFDTVKHRLFSDMPASALTAYGVACVADMAAAADIIRVEYIQAVYFPVINGNGAFALSGKKFRTAFHIERLLLWKSYTVLNDLVPYPYHIRQIARCVFSDRHFYSFAAALAMLFIQKLHQPRFTIGAVNLIIYTVSKLP